MSKLKDLTGQRFGSLTVIERAENTPQGQARWKCKCDCGNETIVRGSQLRRGDIISCHCVTTQRVTERNTTHGHAKERLYNVWCGMRQRCHCETHISYKYYGGRGIKVCSEWDDYSKFRQWALDNGYDESLKRGDCTLDRIDVDKDYSPDNCRWVSMKVQASNKR